jgi:hypothetical protein
VCEEEKCDHIYYMAILYVILQFIVCKKNIMSGTNTVEDYIHKRVYI